MHFQQAIIERKRKLGRRCSSVNHTQITVWQHAQERRLVANPHRKPSPDISITPRPPAVVCAVTEQSSGLLCLRVESPPPHHHPFAGEKLKSTENKEGEGELHQHPVAGCHMIYSKTAFSHPEER